MILIHQTQPKLLPKTWRFDLYQRPSLEEAGTRFFRFLARREDAIVCWYSCPHHRLWPVVLPFGRVWPERLLWVEKVEPLHSVVTAVISHAVQWLPSPSICSRWTLVAYMSTFCSVFVVHCVKLMPAGSGYWRERFFRCCFVNGLTITLTVTTIWLVTAVTCSAPPTIRPMAHIPEFVQCSWCKSSKVSK